MIGRQRSGVFLSYARKDGEEFAATLRDRLRTHAADIHIQQDRLLLEGGVGWWKQLTEAIDAVEFLVLVMTPSAMESETVRKEWRYARQQGVCVYPVKGAPDSALRFDALPRWMSKAHFFDIDKEWDSLVAHLRKGCDVPRVPFMAPDLPDHFVQRPTEFEALKSGLLSPDRKRPLAVTTALSGAGGFGKTTLAAALCHDEDILQNFDDGILWVTLGQAPNIVNSLTTAYAALTGDRPGFVTEEDAAFQFGQKLEDRNCLLVIDDVWDAAHLRPFLRGGHACARLFTTRDAEIASESERVNVDEMREGEAVAVLTFGVVGLSEQHARELARRLGEWPIALELARATMRQQIEKGESAKNAAQYIFDALAEEGVDALEKRTADPRHRTVSAVLSVSLQLLAADDSQDLAKLSIFPEDVAIPLSAAGGVWGTTAFATKKKAQRLARLSLVKLDLRSGTLGLHDVMRSWLARRVDHTGELHSRLVASWPEWRRLADEYAWRWLTWHLAQAERKPDIARILHDGQWLQAKLDATDVNSLIADFEHLRPSREAELMQAALRLSAHVLAVDKGQLWSQLAGRLGREEWVRPVLQSFRSARTSLVPTTSTLTAPGEAELRTLSGHTSGVRAVAVYGDGRRAISASGDRTIKVWDLETGAELLTLSGHIGPVFSVAVYGDGRRAISASYDQTLKVWDLETGAELRTLSGHTLRVTAVAVYGDGRRAISASQDETLKVWDLETGAELRTLSGHTAQVNAVAVYGDGRRAISASDDEMLKLWDLEAGAELRTLSGHTKAVTAVAVYGDGRRAISASGKTLIVWDLETGTELRTLSGHTDWVRAVAVYGDGRRAISASWDQTLKLWDLETGAELRTLSGHTAWGRAVAVYGDGRRAISASDDQTLKLWDLETGAELRTLSGHTNSVSAVAVYGDGRRAISASWDRTLKVWDLEAGAELHTLSGHTSGVSAVAVYGDGRRAISASDDQTLKVWDLEAGAELRTLSGHTGWVTAVAVYGDGRRAISASADQTLKVWDLETGAELRTLSGHTRGVTAVAVYGEGQRAISASHDETLKVWDLETGAELRTLFGHTREVRAVAVYGDGRRAISASADQKLKVWDLETGAEIRTLSGHTSVVTAVSVYDEGRRAVSASWDETLKVWDLETGAEICTLSGHTNRVRAVAVYGDGRRAISASDDRKIVLWDLANGNAIASFFADAPIRDCAIARDAIVAGGQLGRVHILRVVEPEETSTDNS